MLDGQATRGYLGNAIVINSYMYAAVALGLSIPYVIGHYSIGVGAVIASLLAGWRSAWSP